MRSRSLNELRSPKTLIKNQVSFAGTDSVFSVFDTYLPADQVTLRAESLLFCSQITGRKIIHDPQDVDKYMVGPGGAFFLTPGNNVSIDCPDASFHSPTTCLSVEISTDKVKEMSEVMGSLCSIKPSAYSVESLRGVVCFDHTPATQELMGRMLSAVLNGEQDRDVLIDLGVKELIVRILRSTGVELLVDYAIEAPDENGLNAAINYINKNLSQPISISGLAKLACMSRSRFYAEFKKQVGCAPGQLQQKLRLKEAAKRLSRNELATAICYDLGFSDPSHFSRSFRDWYGCSPREYKNKAISGKSDLSDGELNA